MGLIEELEQRQTNANEPFLIGQGPSLRFAELADAAPTDLSVLRRGDVVALIGNFDAASISTFLTLVDLECIIVPLTEDTRTIHPYFFASAEVDAVIENGRAYRPERSGEVHPLIRTLREKGHGGLVLFSSGTTGRPKAILHDFERFLARYRTRRPALRIMSFLLFDHIGGINTLFHTLFNGGLVIVPSDRTPDAIIRDVLSHHVEVLPTTPTFLRMMLLSGLLDNAGLPDLRVITYGTERMDQPTLDRLCEKLPEVDFRQTYGMSELGILRVKSRARDSLWMKVGGEGVKTRVTDNILLIHSENRMLGYLNAPSPFVDGWYDTNDLVEQDGDYIRVVGRKSDFINVGGVKVLPSEVERVALMHPGVLHTKAFGADNPITGQHIEVVCQPRAGHSLGRAELREHFNAHLPEAIRPHRIRIGDVGISHRFKKDG